MRQPRNAWAGLWIVFLVVLCAALVPSTADAHRSGCHRWHSCPSDTGSYVCGDTGHCSGCPDNQYCAAGQPKGQAQDQLAADRKGSSADFRAGEPPKDAWTCPLSHPIKGNFTTYSGERCIYHMQGGEFFNKTKPERCYATEADAVKDGCRRSKR